MSTHEKKSDAPGTPERLIKSGDGEALKNPESSGGNLGEKQFCPICEAQVFEADQWFPFCSQRCKLVDLNKWFTGRYMTSRPADNDTDELE